MEAGQNLTPEQLVQQLKEVDGAPPIQAPVTPPVAEATPPVQDTPAEVPVATQEPTTPPETPPVEQKPAGAADFETQAKMAELQRKVAEYEAKQNVSPFANDLSKRMDDLLKGGATPTELQRFLELQSLDVTTMSDEDAIKTQWRLDYPTLTDREIEAKFRKQFSPEDSEDEDDVTLASARLKTEALGAKAKLNEKKVNSVPDGVRQAELDQARIQQAEGQWGSVVPALGQTIDFSHKDEEVDFQFQYNVPETVLANVRQAAAKWAAANNVPLNQEGAAQVTGFIETAVYANQRKEIKAAIAKSAFAQALKQVKTEEAGGPVAKPSITAQEPATKDWRQQLKEADMVAHN